MCWCVLNNYLYYEMLIIFSRFAPISRRLTTAKEDVFAFWGRARERAKTKTTLVLLNFAGRTCLIQDPSFEDCRWTAGVGECDNFV